MNALQFPIAPAVLRGCLSNASPLLLVAVSAGEKGQKFGVPEKELAPRIHTTKDGGKRNSKVDFNFAGIRPSCTPSH